MADSTPEKISPMCVAGSALGASVAFPAVTISLGWLLAKLLIAIGLTEPPDWLIWLRDHAPLWSFWLALAIGIALIAYEIYPHCRRRRGR